MDKLTCLRAFVDVVDHGGFSSAARNSGQSKALVSKYVAQLEEALGLRLLHRTTRQVSTTTLGQAYYERCREILNDLDELDASVQSEHQTPCGQLKINAPTSFAELWLMPVLARYAERYPNVIVDLHTTDRYVDLVSEGVDIAVRIGELPDSSLVARKIGMTTMLPCAAPVYLEANGEPIDPQQLKQHRCILDANYSHTDRWLIGDSEHGEWVRIQPHMRVNSARAARELALQGFGIGLLPSFVVRQDIEQRRLRPLFVNHEPTSQGIYAVYTHRRHLSAKVQLFIDALRESLANQNL